MPGGLHPKLSLGDLDALAVKLGNLESVLLLEIVEQRFEARGQQRVGVVVIDLSIKAGNLITRKSPPFGRLKSAGSSRITPA
jgi:hypothetical protein